MPTVTARRWLEGWLEIETRWMILNGIRSSFSSRTTTTTIATHCSPQFYPRNRSLVISFYRLKKREKKNLIQLFYESFFDFNHFLYILISLYYHPSTLFHSSLISIFFFFLQNLMLATFLHFNLYFMLIPLYLILIVSEV